MPDPNLKSGSFPLVTMNLNQKIKLATVVVGIVFISAVIFFGSMPKVTPSLRAWSKSFFSQDPPVIGWRPVIRQTEIFSAYYDDRGNPSIVVLGLQSGVIAKNDSIHFYCLFQYEYILYTTAKCVEEPAIVDIVNPWDENSDYTFWPYSFTCKVRPHLLPIYVSLTIDKECRHNVSSWMPISFKQPRSSNLRTFGVCVETAIFNAVPIASLIESIERNRAMGAEWLTVYVYKTSEAVMKVLRDYESEGVLEIVDWNLSNYTLKYSKYYAESVSIADCVYRNMYKVKYLVFVDLDELIVPRQHRNWMKMVSAIDKTDIGAFQFNHVTTYPKDYYKPFNWTCTGGRSVSNSTRPPLFLRHLRRTLPYSVLKDLVWSGRQKVMTKPVLIKKMGIHSAISFFNSARQHTVPAEIGLMYHYRVPPFPLKCGHNCSQYIVDDTRVPELLPHLAGSIRNRHCHY